MKKRAISLLEIMIVIFLIALIGGVVGYNMKGSMDKGKAFKTKEAMSRVKEILYLVASENQLSLEEVVNNKEENLRKSGMVKNPSELLKDGWGNPFKIEVEYQGRRNNREGKIVISSVAYDTYNQKMGINVPNEED